MKRFSLRRDDCVKAMQQLEAGSVSAIVTDPPYGLKFMGKDWDDAGEGAQQREWHRQWLEQAYRVLMPGGMLAAFAGSRTYHHLACAAEDVGFVIVDELMWVYGSGFPKSLDVSKAIDKQRDEDRAPRVAVTSWTKEQCELRGWTRAKLCKHFGVKNNPVQSWTETNPDYAVVPTLEVWCELKKLVGFGDDMDAEVWRLNGRKGQPGENWFKREITGKAGSLWEDWEETAGGSSTKPRSGERRDKPATAPAAQWEGWGTALKPAHEPILLAQKPAGVEPGGQA